jgi:hypothetical protein
VISNWAGWWDPDNRRMAYHRWCPLIGVTPKTRLLRPTMPPAEKLHRQAPVSSIKVRCDRWRAASPVEVHCAALGRSPADRRKTEPTARSRPSQIRPPPRGSPRCRPKYLYIESVLLRNTLLVYLCIQGCNGLICLSNNYKTCHIRLVVDKICTEMGQKIIYHL